MDDKWTLLASCKHCNDIKQVESRHRITLCNLTRIDYHRLNPILVPFLIVDAVKFFFQLQRVKNSFVFPTLEKQRI